MGKPAKIPSYLTEIYSWLYFNPKLYNFLDNSVLLNCLTFGGHHLLTEELIKEIYPHSSVLQVGATLGSQIEKTYTALRMKGTYTIVDVNPQILADCREKHLDQRISFVRANVARGIKGEYDIIICYMLLHELPPLTRSKVLENIINALRSGGKAIFIDYHCPLPFHPLKYPVRTFNRLYQPFAETLWKQSIKSLTPNKEKCTWTKQTYYGGLYQKVVATKES